MTNKIKHAAGTTLRQRAESRFLENVATLPENTADLSPDAVRQMLHELRVHQIELEMQNEELRHAQEDLAASRAAYFDLYDLAPVGYCTISDQGLILQANLTAANMLGVTRGALLRQPVTRYIRRNDQDSYHLQRKQLVENGQPQSYELRLIKGDGTVFWAHIAATVVREVEGKTVLRIAISDVSARKQVEVALHKSETFSLAILDSLNAEIAVLDRDGRIVAVNQAWRRFAVENSFKPGKPSPHVGVGTNYLTVCKTNNAVGAHDGILAVLDGRMPSFLLEYACHSPSQQRWFSMSVTPLGDGVVISHTNITELKLAEDALREQKEFFHLIAENIGDFIAVLDLDGRRLYNSPSYEQFFGATSDLQGTDSFAEIHPDDRERIKRVFRETVQTGIGRQMDFRFHMADGSVRHMESRGRVIRDNAGRVARVVVVSHDVTERKRAEAEMRIAAAAFESQEGIVVTDADNVILRVNSAFSKITGYSAEEAIGQNITFLKSDRQSPDFFASMWEAIQRDGSWHGEIWNRIKNGEMRPHWLTISAVRNSDDVITHYVGAYTDITERNLMEEQVRQLAFHDPLTQLPNRRLLNDRLSQTMAASTRNGLFGALMFLDLDNFKMLNDTQGHGVGDMLLIEAASRLKSCVREMDTVARFGGDEFVIMISQLDADKTESTAEAGIIAEKIRVALAEPYTLTIRHDGQADSTVVHQCTASIGVALFIDHYALQDDILKWADRAMYQAKEAGRNRVRFYEQTE